MTGGNAIWKPLVLVVCLAAGLLLATTRLASDGTELRSTDSGRISDLVRAAQTGADAAESERDALAAQVAALQSTAAGSDGAVADALAEAEQLAAAAALTPVSGTGVTVTLTDAPRGPDGNYPLGARPDDLVVHQQDIESVLNALWSAGASAVGMQDQRIVSSSAPRCIGSTLLLHGRTYSPPYRLTAIGDPARLEATLDAEPGVRLFREYAQRYGLGYSVRIDEQLTVPGFDGATSTRYARPIG